ncbi:glycoside hydrolase family 3 N-terminal domain-containing protein [Propionibacterium australiense]|uniref:Beta-glucosidase n=1 Tax=Propionibacterium australiense TaxID=119981 RepID=A0A383S7A9_9ACTN|nr:glycoside hydrolase family 3 N-terminal domain-containing protein [Propionibacterium australiense]RLP09514.1 beta-glucosidase [Propionibacterium australiense]RLP09906.1 beta-glucosidase [Propionibacterium australiense]SYZ33817.1 beta-glucosidase [Propionibacterium australiense]VEH91951.1 Thermostable beta-glucosidase B [Propionibacterium australiense]
MTTVHPDDYADRASELVAAMTLDEKASLTSGADFWNLKTVERLGLGAVMVTDGPHGLRKATNDAEIGIGQAVPATCFPTAAALGSTWDDELLEQVGAALGEEARAAGVAVVLGPGVNMKRSPLCGRNFEYFSEDPLVAGRAGAAMVRGVQSQGVGTSVKHFAANSQETDRMRIDARIGERALREIYLPAFERIVTQTRPWTVMCAYNKVNGTYASQHPWLLTTVLREDWGFGGLVVSDWGAVDQRVPGLAAGLDLEMPASGGVTDEQIARAVRTGELDEAVLDRAVQRIVALILAAQAVEPGTGFDTDAHHELARKAAAAGAVLLRNEPVDGSPVLPLDARDITGQAPLVVIGEFARTPRYQGAGSSQINPTRLDSALDALREQLGGAVRFEPGYRLAEATGMPGQELTDDELADRAVEAARGATVVLFAGLPAAVESEGYDRDDIELPNAQTTLIERVSAVAARTTVVLSNGSVVSVASWREKVDALLECWLGGQGGGSATADVLLGRSCPGGHLAESIPLALSDVPAQLNFPGSHSRVDHGEGVFVGYRGLDTMGREVAYPFGFGLTYTTFELTGVQATPVVTVADGTGLDETVAVVRGTLTNTGQRTGAQVVQLYLGRHEASRVARAPRELRGYEKITLAPGQSAPFEFALSRRDLSYWDEGTGCWQVEPGAYRAWVGFSSRDAAAVLPLQVTAPEPASPLGKDSTYAEWMAHPVGGPLLRTDARAFVDDMASSGAYELFAAMPLERLVRLPGSLLAPEDYLTLLDRAQAGQD